MLAQVFTWGQEAMSANILLPQVNLAQFSDHARDELAALVREQVQAVLADHGHKDAQPAPSALDARAAAAYCGVSRSHFLQLRREDPTFPQPIRLGRRVVWMIADLNAWLASHRTPARA